MRDTARTALIFLSLGALFSIIPFAFTFIILLPVRLLGLIFLLLGFRLVLGSRTDDIKKYKGKAIISPILFIVSLTLIPLAGFLMVYSTFRADETVWKVLFFVSLALIGLVSSFAYGLFQFPLRRGFGKVMLIIVMVVTLIITAGLPALSGTVTSWAGDKVEDQFDSWKGDIYDWSEPTNNSVNMTVTNTSDVNETLEQLPEYLKNELLNPILEAIHNNTNKTVDIAKNVTSAVITFGAPTLLFDLGMSFSSFLWLILLTGTIVTMGRLKQKERDEPEEDEESEDEEQEEPEPDIDIPEEEVEATPDDEEAAENLIEETFFQEQVDGVDLAEEPE